MYLHSLVAIPYLWMSPASLMAIKCGTPNGNVSFVIIAISLSSKSPFYQNKEKCSVQGNTTNNTKQEPRCTDRNVFCSKSIIIYNVYTNTNTHTHTLTMDKFMHIKIT